MYLKLQLNNIVIFHNHTMCLVVADEIIFDRHLPSPRIILEKTLFQ